MQWANWTFLLRKFADFVITNKKAQNELALYDFFKHSNFYLYLEISLTKDLILNETTWRYHWCAQNEGVSD